MNIMSMTILSEKKIDRKQIARQTEPPSQVFCSCKEKSERKLDQQERTKTKGKRFILLKSYAHIDLHKVKYAHST